MREIHYEETTWKARPDWAPDGRRVVYSSYHGRQWNQLWLMTGRRRRSVAADLRRVRRTAPRWSPRRAAHRRTSPTKAATRRCGRRRAGRAATARRRRGRAATSSRGAAGRDRRRRARPAGPCRRACRSPRADGRSFAPDDAWRHADEAFVARRAGFEYGYFHTEGRAAMTVPAGAVVGRGWRGPEYATRAPGARPWPRRDAGGPRWSLAAAGRPAGARVVGRRPPRPHELRRALSEHAGAPGLPGARPRACTSSRT